MNCPSDGTTLLMSERQGVEIDYCPECRGVWLDRGELDKIIGRVQTEADAILTSPAPPAPATAQPPPAQSRYDDRRRDDDRRYKEERRYEEERRREAYYDDHGSGDPRYGDPRYRKKKKSPFDFLGDIFE